MTAALSFGLLVLRVVGGLILAAHGAQKLFGWSKGPGFEKFSQGMEMRGLKPGTLWTSLAVLGEFGGGLSLAFGFLTPLGAAGATAAMLMAMLQHVNNGFWLANRGYEYALSLLTIGLALGFTGPGRYSLDSLFGITLPGVQLFLVLAALGLITVAIGYGLMRQHAAATPPAGEHPAAQGPAATR